MFQAKGSKDQGRRPQCTRGTETRGSVVGGRGQCLRKLLLSFLPGSCQTLYLVVCELLWASLCPPVP